MNTDRAKSRLKNLIENKLEKRVRYYDAVITSVSRDANSRYITEVRATVDNLSDQIIRIPSGTAVKIGDRVRVGRKGSVVNPTWEYGGVEASSLEYPAQIDDDAQVETPQIVSISSEAYSASRKCKVTITIYTLNISAFYTVAWKLTADAWTAESHEVTIGPYPAAGSIHETKFIEVPNLITGISYDFKVRAEDKQGRKSSFSAATTKIAGSDSSIPNPPTPNVTDMGNYVKITWTGVTYPDIIGYNVYMADDAIGTNQELVGFVDGNFKSVYDYGKYYAITLVNDSGNESSVSSWQIDNNAPSPPSGAIANGLHKSIALRWLNPTDDDFKVTRVYRNDIDDFSTANLITRIAFDSSYVDSGLPVNSTKYYWLRAEDFAGNLSTLVSGISAATVTISGADFDTTPPAIPSGLNLSQGVVVSKDGTISPWLDATWSGNTESDFDHYVVRVKPDGGSYLYYDSDVNVIKWNYLPITESTDYYVGVRAVDVVGNKSDFSSDASVTVQIDTTPPAQTSGVSVQTGFHVASLKWTPNTESDLLGYDIQRSTTGAFVGEEVDLKRQSVHFFADTELDTDTWYWWRVRAVDTSLNVGNWSNLVSGITLKIQDSIDIAAGTIIADHIAAGQIATGHITTSGLSASVITADELQSANWGAAAGSQFDLDDGNFYLGGSDSPKLSWNGSTLAIIGQIQIGSTGYANLGDKPTQLSTINNTEGTKLNAGLDNTGNVRRYLWGGNLDSGSIGTGLNMSSSYIGYHSGVAWTVYIKSDGTFYFAGDASNYVQWDGSTLTVEGTIQTGVSPNPRVIFNSSGIIGYSNATTVQFQIDSSSGEGIFGAGTAKLTSAGLIITGDSTEMIQWQNTATQLRARLRLVSGDFYITSYNSANMQIASAGGLAIYAQANGSIWGNYNNTAGYIFFSTRNGSGTPGQKDHVFAPETTNMAGLGSADYYWKELYAGDIYYKNIDTFDIYDDLKIIDSMKDGSIPKIISDNGFVKAGKSMGLAFGGIRQIHKKIKQLEDMVRDLTKEIKQLKERN